MLVFLLQRLDVEKETIELVHANPTDTRDLPGRVPTDTPRYHFFLYKHSHEGDYLESVGTAGTNLTKGEGYRAALGSQIQHGDTDMLSVGSLHVINVYLCGIVVFVAVFIYSMPGSSCRIKERMLYSSCKSRLLEDVAKDYHLEVAKKVTDKGAKGFPLWPADGSTGISSVLED